MLPSLFLILSRVTLPIVKNHRKYVNYKDMRILFRKIKFTKFIFFLNLAVSFVLLLECDENTALFESNSLLLWIFSVSFDADIPAMLFCNLSIPTANPFQFSSLGGVGSFSSESFPL